MTTPHDHATPPELRPIEDALEGLARSERAAAPGSFEDRIYHASRASLHAGAAPIPIAAHLSGRWARLAVAAAVVLCGGIAVLVASRMAGPQTPGGISPTAPTIMAASLEEDVELWLSLRTPDEFQSVADRIDLLTVETDTLAPAQPDDLSGLLDTDAM